jgi:SAM-dependent methyltransferase
MSLDESKTMLPSIWRGDLRSAADWTAAQPNYAILEQAADAIDDRLIVSMHPFDIRGWCVVCRTVRPMAVNWRSFCHLRETASIKLAGTEVAHCHGCGLHSRVRALFAHLADLRLSPDSCVYVSERVTATYQRLAEHYPGLIGSEYLGPTVVPGEIRHWTERDISIRHENLTRLSFATGSLDVVLTLDVFEHIPDFRAAFRECRRVLRTGGDLIFTIPFFPELTMTEIRAVVGAGGDVQHILPPEIHGNPITAGGSLCFQHFGWDMFDDLRNAGFSSAVAKLYWGPWQGHIGLPGFLFHAVA